MDWNRNSVSILDAKQSVSREVGVLASIYKRADDVAWKRSGALDTSYVYERLRDVLNNKASGIPRALSGVFSDAEKLVRSCTREHEPNAAVCIQPKAALDRFLAHPGKGMRVVLLRQVYQHWVEKNVVSDTQANRSVFLGIATLVEGMHNLTLIVDDCIDRDLYRRGEKTIYALSGEAGVLQTTALLLSALEEVVATLDVSLQRKYAIVAAMERAAADVARAVGNEIRWQSSTAAIDWENTDVASVVRTYVNKTAVVMSLGVELLGLALCTEDQSTEQFHEALYELGLILQRVNDIENYFPMKDSQPNADRFGDIRERRVTLLMLRPEFTADASLKLLRERAFNSPLNEALVADFGDKVISSGMLAVEARDTLLHANRAYRRLSMSTSLSDETKSVFGYVLGQYLKPITRDTNSLRAF